MAKPSPVIGEWYRRSGGESFEVVAIDRDDRTIEIQYFDGTVEELEVDEWIEGEFQATEPPEDWTGSLDVDSEVQRYIPSNNRSLRVVIIGDEITSYWRQREDANGFHASLSKGAKLDVCADPELKEAAEKLVADF